MARRKRKPKSRQKLQRGFAIIALLALLAAIMLVAVLDRRVTQQFEGRRWTLPARVYAQPLELYAGQNLSSARFAQELERLGYIPQTPVDRPGTFRRKGDSVDVYVREFRFSDETQPAQKLRVGFDGEAIAALAGADGADVPVFRLDPLLIGSIFPIHGEDRIIVSPAEVPPLLPEALKAVEDRKFESHHGVNPLAILRALFVNVRAGQVEQGGSTLTQQLVKSYFLDSRRTLRRKGEEAIMAFILESRFEKADIMNAYINEIYLGQDGRRAVHGFGLASQFYFGKPLRRAEPARDRADGGDRARAVVLRSAAAAGARARAPQPGAEGAGRAGRREARRSRARDEGAARHHRQRGPLRQLFPGLPRPRAAPAARGLPGAGAHRDRTHRLQHARSRCCRKRPRSR